MRIEDLKIFADIVRYQSMTVAAEKNFISVQTISKIIRNLEDEFQTNLFYRSKKGSFLTEKGEQIYEQVLQVLSEYEKLQKIAFDELTETNPLAKQEIRVLCNEGAAYYAVTNAYKKLQKIKLFDSINLEIETTPEVLFREFYDHDIILFNLFNFDDITFFANIPNFFLLNIIRDEYIILISDKHAFADYKIISINDVRKSQFAVMRNGYLYTEIFGTNKKPSFVTDSANALIELIEQSENLCTVVSKSAVKLYESFHNREGTNLIKIPLEQKYFGYFVVLVNKEEYNNVALMNFVKKISEYMAGKDIL